MARKYANLQQQFELQKAVLAKTKQDLDEKNALMKSKVAEIGGMAQEATKNLAKLGDLEKKVEKTKKKASKKKDEQPKKVYAARNNKIPEVIDNVPDNRPQETPKFTSYVINDKEIVTASAIAGIHAKFDINNLANDRQFVYSMFKYIFNRTELQTMSLTGTKIFNDANKVIGRKNVLDKKRVAYAYRQYFIRGNAIGINDNHRMARSEMKYFKVYVTGLTKSARTYFLQLQKNPRAHGGPGASSSKDKEDDSSNDEESSAEDSNSSSAEETE